MLTNTINISADYLDFIGFCSEVEDELTVRAGIPIVGSGFALCKMIFGLLQAAISIVLSSFLLLHCFLNCFSEDSRLCFSLAGSHVLHGMANIIGGALQVIPIIGTLFAMPVFEHFYAPGRVGSTIYFNDQSHKYLGYELLSKNSWRLETVLDENERHGEARVPEGNPRMDASFGYC
jgi:hypothetical protein